MMVVCVVFGSIVPNDKPQAYPGRRCSPFLCPKLKPLLVYHGLHWFFLSSFQGREEWPFSTPRSKKSHFVLV